MVRALLAGTKTQTRRAWKIQPDDDGRVDVGNRPDTCGIAYVRGASGGQCTRVPCPYGAPGDLVWVRETHWINEPDIAMYRADGEMPPHMAGTRWRSPIHMPRWASRLTLRLADVRVNQVQDISEDDARAEGFDHGQDGYNYRLALFGRTWDTINAKHGYGWDSNPWVWALTFDVLRCNIDEVTP